MKRIVLLIILLLNLGCATSVTTYAPQIPTSSELPPPSTTMIVSQTPITVRATIPNVPSSAPLPTLPPTESEAKILEFLQNNGGCYLPCWWGLIPGETTAQEAKSLLEKFAVNSLGSHFYDDVGGTSLRINKDGLLLDLVVSLTYDRELSNVVESLRITAEVKKRLEGGGFETVWDNPLSDQYLQEYNLSEILSIYGQPENVFIFANEGWKYFSLILDYSKRGVVVWYSAPLESSGNNYKGCMSKTFTNLYLWIPEFSYNWAEGVIGREDKGEIESLNRNFQPLEQVTSLTLDEFYTIFTQTNINCIETPKDLWPGP